MSACCSAIAGQFDAAYVAREVESRRKDGLKTSAVRLADAVTSVQEQGELAGASALDVGGGLGDVLASLFPRGLAEATHIEVSPEYSAAASELADEAGYGDRVTFVVGDLVEMGDLPAFDVVTLDRVICCYPDMPSLLDASVERARSLYALSAPRSRWPVRAAIGAENLLRRLKGNPFRTYVHSWTEMEQRLLERGFERVHDVGTLIWRVAVYRARRGIEAADDGGRPTEP